MTNPKSMIERLLKKLGLAAPDAPQPAPAVVQPPPIPNPPPTLLQQDWELYESRTYLSILDANAIEQNLIKKYAGVALPLLFQELDKQPGAGSKEAALENIEYVCRDVVSKKYPVGWSVLSVAKTEFGSTTRHWLNKHALWINENGAYCIVHRYTYQLIFSKPDANNCAFVPPPNFGNGS